IRCTNSYYGTVEQYGTMLDRSEMDLEDLLHYSSKKGKKKLTASETSSDVNVEPRKRPRKTTANKKRASQTIDLEFLENQVQTHPPTLAHTEEPIPKTSQREVVSREWNEAQLEISRLNKEVEEVKRANKVELEAARKEAKDKCELCQKLQEERSAATAKLKGTEANTKERCNAIAKRSIYRAWMENPEMDLSFLGKGMEEVLAYYEQAKKVEEEAEA
uniref:Uncharacterized protein n=1 Tax=Cannabis sativa TaxID=3483 RepID=A0A803QRT5_CANSA